MFKNTAFLLALGFPSTAALANDEVCRPMATLAKMSAEERDKGVSQDALLKGLVREGKLDPRESSAQFVIATVMWVYDEKVPAKIAYKRMYAKCESAFSKRR
jgi:formaldehyde-activating enzyme involved in methanogenesis